MKTNKYQRRFYRDFFAAKDLHSVNIIVKETDLQVLTDKPIDKSFIKKRITFYRGEIENYINNDRRFLTSLKPQVVAAGAPLIIRAMSQAAKEANVGPMASVAGAIAEFVGRDLLKSGNKEVIIENGGDIFLKVAKKRKIGIYAGKSSLWNRVSLVIKPQDTPLGICASSGKIGHSLSFGLADSVVILSPNACLADAVATAAANRVNAKQDIKKVVDFVRKIKGVIGIVVIFENNFASWGKIELTN